VRRAQVNYKNVMKQYNLGPNGGILTALNLFATRFDQARAAGRSPRPHTSCQTNASRKVSAAPPPFLKRCRCSALVARAQSRTLALAFQGFKGQFKGFQALACRRAGRGAVRAAARPAAALHRGGHTRADRDLHLVGVGRNYHRGARVGLPDHGRVRGGHAALRTPADLHEQHAAGARARAHNRVFCPTVIPLTSAPDGRRQSLQALIDARSTTAASGHAGGRSSAARRGARRAAGAERRCARRPQAVSILYKTQLPLLLVFNKVDVMAHDFAVAWMRDYEAFRAAIAADSTYAAELSRSLCLVRARASAVAMHQARPLRASTRDATTCAPQAQRICYPYACWST